MAAFEPTFRLMTESDAGDSIIMSEEAFGVSADRPTTIGFGNGTERWGLYDAETLAAKTVIRDYRSWFGGREVPTAGIAGVAVAPEYRGTGAARDVMSRTLVRAKETGAAISTLFRTAPALYRSLGYEQIAELTTGQLPTAALARIRRPEGVRVRRAGAADVPAIKDLYAEIAATASGLLSRRGPGFDSIDAARTVESFTGITLAEEVSTGRLIGYLSWERGSGFGATAAITVSDLLAVSGDGYRALLSQLGSWGSVAPMIRIRTTGADPIHWHLPDAGWSVADVMPYMLRVIDAPAAIAARGWPVQVSGSIGVTLEDPLCPWNSGNYALTVDGGEASLEPAAEAGLPISPTGLAVLYGGGVDAATLHRAGLIDGGRLEPADAALLDAAFAGPRPSILDFF